MIDHTVTEAVVELRRIFKEDLTGPFPYADCRRLRASSEGTYEGLIPDFDLYFWEVAKYCSLGKKLLRLPKDDLSKARATLTKSFFEKHPEYLPLAALINETATPTLHADLKLHDELRRRLLAVVSTLLAEAAAAGNEMPAQATAAYATQRKLA